MEKSLADIKHGYGAAAVKINLAGALKRRVMDMVITKGAIVPEKALFPSLYRPASAFPV